MIRLILLVVGAILVWLVLTQPATAGPVVGVVLKDLGVFLKEVLTSLVKLVSAVSSEIRSAS